MEMMKLWFCELDELTVAVCNIRCCWSMGEEGMQPYVYKRMQGVYVCLMQYDV